METLNGDLSRRISVNTAAMDWIASPSRTVWRKRVHLVGSPEAGQVTSVVRYDPGSNFPAHEHPDGEEIFVLEGVFSDEHGDWPAGTYLLNPEGFRHAPFSRDGCVLFVKLRQFPDRSREHVALRTQDLPWQATNVAGVESKLLYSQSGFSDTMRLERWLPGTARGMVRYPFGVEFFVLDGAFEDSEGQYDAGSWLRIPAGADFSGVSESGCSVFIKENGFRYLQSSPEAV
jgi:anti-sigma factor ChrR (cupin superfamily)